jgi:hypothetical protein
MIRNLISIFEQSSSNPNIRYYTKKSKHHPNRFSIIISFFLIICYSLLFSNVITCTSADGTSSSSGPELIGYSVTPRSGTVEDEFVFLMIYRDHDNREPEYIKLIIDENEYDLDPLSSDDKNFSDGKNYFNKLKLSKGVHIYYFEASNGVNVTISSANTIIVNGEPEEYTHLDVTYSVLFATMVFVIIFIYGIYHLKKLSRSLEDISKKDKQKRNKN